MANLTAAVEKFISSIFGIFHNLLNSVFAVFQSILAVFQTILTSAFELAKGLLDFVMSNILVLGVIAVGFVIYTAVLQRNGTAPAGQGLGARKGVKA